MKFSKKAEYAVILASELASCDKRRSLREISQGCQISYALLRKVAHEMAVSGLIHGEEGKGGGYLLAKAKDEIYLKEILASVGETMANEPCCNGDKPCACSAVCPRNSVLCSLQSAMDEMLGSLSLSKLVKGRTSCIKIWQ